MKAYANEEMMKEALGEEYDSMNEPANCEVDREHVLWPLVSTAIREVFDPEIPVNVYELGLLYKIDFTPRDDGKYDIYVEMTLTSPACPVAQEMPMMVQAAFLPLEGVENVDVDIIWDPPWDPSMMAETAKYQLNMFT